ncbi:hypothetical protein ACROYT_G011433 [Oculina patagonica]
MASGPPLVASTKKTTNFARLCRVLVDVGSQALRDTFDSIYAPANLQLVLTRSKPVIQSLRMKRIVNPIQWSKLYPVTPASVSSASFDITLTVVLLRNICGLTPPVTGWDTLPSPGDTSREADIARVKYFRNTIYGHAEQASVDDVTFNQYWQDIRDTLVRLGGVQYGVAIDTLETECMDPDVEDHYKELLKQWKMDDDNMKDKLSEVETELEKVKKQVDDLTAIVAPKKDIKYFPTEVVQKIRQGYMNNVDHLRSPAWCKEFNFHLESLFTKLRIVKKTGAKPTKKTIHLTDVFNAHKSGQKPRTVLIEGKPGIGKTTYCQKLAYDWARRQEELQRSLPQVQVLLSLQCRDISLDIWKAIDAQLLPEDVDEQAKEMFFKFIRENQSKILLILDGVDDMPPEKLQLVSQLVSSELPQCHFLLTADQATAAKMREYCYTWLEIVGFTEQDAKTFISRYFEDQKHLAEKLTEVLDKFDSLRKEVVPGNPVYTALLCLLCKDLNGVFPRSSTQLYTEIVRCALRRFQGIKGKSSSSKDPIEVYKDQLAHLGLIAFNYQRKGDAEFEENEVSANIGDLPEFGFISAQTAASTRRPRLWYGFEQFFAGFFLASQILSDEIDLNSIIADQSYFNKPALKQVFLYMSGILSLLSEEKALDLVKGFCSRINSLRLGNAEEIKELQGLLLLSSECRKYDSDSNDKFNSKLTETLGSSLELETFTLGSLFGHNYKDLLKSNVFKSSWYKGNVCRCSCPLIQGLAGPFFEALKSNTTLSTLLLGYNEIELSGVKALSGALKVNSTLTNLDLSGNKIGSPGAEALSDALQINTTLTSLDLSKNEISAAGIQSLSEALKSNAALTTLNLCANTIGEPREESRSRPREISIIPCIH